MQVVCRNTSEEQIRKALASFDLARKPEARTGHVLVELRASDPTDRILMVCRKQAYAYLRLVAWERGGGLEATSDATCVAGTEGQPLRPVAVTLKGERANGEHALFGSRTGLIVVNVRRRGSKTTVTVTMHRIREFKVAPPKSIISDTFDCASQQWLTDLQTRMDLDKYVPVVRSALRKAECTFCAHCHYREVEESRGSGD